MGRFSLLTLGTIALGFNAVGHATAADEVSFKGKRVESIVVSTAGGGTDTSTRLIGRYLGKYLPGQPDVVFRNMPAGHGPAGLTDLAGPPPLVRPDDLIALGPRDALEARAQGAPEAEAIAPLPARVRTGRARRGQRRVGC